MPEFNATLLFVMISFVVFMILMKALFFDPILRVKETRERKVTGDREDARQFLDDYEQIRLSYEAELKQARREAHRIIQEVRQTAKVTAQQTLMDARTQAQSELSAKMVTLAEWRESTYQQLETERSHLTQSIIRKVTHGQHAGTAARG